MLALRQIIVKFSRHRIKSFTTWLLCCSRQFTTIDGRKPLQKRLVHRLMVVLLTIRVKCLCWRAKPAHFVGHLPPNQRIDFCVVFKSVHGSLEVGAFSFLPSPAMIGPNAFLAVWVKHPSECYERGFLERLNLSRQMTSRISSQKMMRKTP